MTELSLAVPQVVAHRVTRMAIAGKALSPRDKKEFQLMASEKKDAFVHSWVAMVAQAARAYQALALSLFAALWSPMRRHAAAAGVVSRFQRAAEGVLSKGVAPIHGKAVASAKRLARTKLR